jgi:hypothetical protein
LKSYRRRGKKKRILSLINGKLGSIAHFGHRSVTIVDMMSVTFVDSTFFNALAQVEDEIFGGTLEGRVCIAMQHACGQRLFHLTEFDQVFPVFRPDRAAV